MNYDFLKIIDDKAEMLDTASDYLWDNPETAFTEFKAAAYYCDMLRKEGFTVEENLANISTAFSGSFGSGKPVIGILGEFDALSGLSQKAGVAEEISAGESCGHGCGHNLFGIAALGAAIAVKSYLEQTGAPGTVVFFGTPGEEGGSGKGFMARDGVFDQLDAALTWHPRDDTRVCNNSSLANCQVLYKFDGVASHAGAKPHLGRSALDACELMNVGVQFLREHIPTSCRVHYAITNSGGFSPNVVQPHAEVLYLMRGVDNKIVKEVYERVNDIAEGAALMTGTKASHEFIKACSNTILNDPIQRMLQKKMEEIGSPEPTQEDIAFAKEITEKGLMTFPDSDPDHPIHWEVAPYHETEGMNFSSTDVGDVSWVCPTAQIYTSTFAKGTPLHSWQLVAQGKMPLAHKMMRYAAKVMAAGVVELLTDAKLLEAAKADHARRVGPEGYQAPIPKDVVPKAMDSFAK